MKKKRILVAGGTGLLGSSLSNLLSKNKNYLLTTSYLNSKPTKLLKHKYKRYDFMKYQDCLKATKAKDVVIVSAVKAGGIKHLKEEPTENLIDNVRINGNKIDTTSGGLELDSSNNVVTVTADISQTGNLTVNGTGSFSGDVTALTSDIRLKTNIEPIKNALDKVTGLNGFTYNHNEIASKLGLNTEIRYAGVSAQDLQEVLPEAVKPCPASDEYLTVQYEKVVPLLIEAIKELKSEIEELKK